jgi:curved DNA-binding protein CbpA
MAVVIPDKDNPYGDRSPFEILGVDRLADANTLKRAKQNKLDDVQDQRLADKERLKSIEEINLAYEQLTIPRRRAVLDIFSFDPRTGDQDCRRRAERLQSVDFDYNRVFKGYHELLPSSPDVDASRLQKRSPVLEKSLALRQSEVHGASELQAEYRASMEFET